MFWHHAEYQINKDGQNQQDMQTDICATVKMVVSSRILNKRKVTYKNILHLFFMPTCNWAIKNPPMSIE